MFENLKKYNLFYSNRNKDCDTRNSIGLGQDEKTNKLDESSKKEDLIVLSLTNSFLFRSLPDLDHNDATS